ncbi:MAG: hypothetical protein IJW55_02020 [Clostridia bacterium]|nr:hypothetical protein [Clostridia bacterium]
MTEITYYEGNLIGKCYKPGFSFDFKLAVPRCDVAEYALLVEHDGQNDANVNSMLRLADEGKAPYCVSIGISPGKLSMPDGTQRKMRMNSYDLFDSEYGDFIVYELIPYISATYSIRFSASPDMHFVSGGSSGGISAFVIAWFHPDYFRRIYMSSPSFLAMGRGNEIPYLLRKYETKPFRIYEEWSEKEPNEYFGWSRAIDEEAKEALFFAGYDLQVAYFPGEGHCSRYRDENEAYKRNQWIWSDWQTKKILAPRHSHRVAKVVPDESKWTICNDFPQKEGATIPKVLAERFGCVVLSNDGQAWYAADPSEDIVHMFVNNDRISIEKGILHAALHTILRFDPKGAIDMAVDKGDRLFVLTKIGIQCVRSFGLIDVILALPDNSEPLEIVIADALYVRTEQGTYRRALCEDRLTDDEQQRKHRDYYD